MNNVPVGRRFGGVEPLSPSGGELAACLLGEWMIMIVNYL